MDKKSYQREWRKRYKEKHGIDPVTAWRRRNPKAARQHRIAEQERWRNNTSTRLRHAQASKRNNQKVREETFDAYGGRFCNCCQESNIKFLTIDHIYNDGAEDRRQLQFVGGGLAFYRWLRKRGYPHGYQVLCYNCNCGKRVNGGVCPHVG